MSPLKVGPIWGVRPISACVMSNYCSHTARERTASQSTPSKYAWPMASAAVARCAGSVTRRRSNIRSCRAPNSAGAPSAAEGQRRATASGISKSVLRWMQESQGWSPRTQNATSQPTPQTSMAQPRSPRPRL